MARKISRRVVLNYKALDTLDRGLADGLAAVGTKVLDQTRPPDAEPFGKGLVTTGGFGVWVGTKKVAGPATRPRSVRLPKGGITLLAGFDFPGRFQEIGTIHQPARPFLTPRVLEELPVVPDDMKAPVRRAMREGGLL